MHFFIIGFMASGKTTLGKKLGEFIHRPVVDLDEYMEKKEGMSIREMFEKKGESYFRNLEKEALKYFSQKEIPHLIICGGGTSCSTENRKRMKETGKIILIECETPILLERLRKEKEERPLLMHISDDDMEEEIQALMIKRKECYSEYDFRFESGKTDLITFAAQLDEDE